MQKILTGGYEYISYLDDDDEWLPEKLEKQLAKFQECDESVGCVYCYYYYADDDKNMLFVPEYLKVCEGDVFDEIMAHDFVASMFPLVRVKCLADAGGFDEEMAANQDYDVWTRTAKVCKFACAAEPLAKLHRYKGEHIWTNFVKPIKGRERFLSKNMQYFEHHRNAYRNHLLDLMTMYRLNGEYTKSLRTWCRVAKAQPFRIAGNIYVLVRQFVLSPTKRTLLKLKGAFMS